MLRKRFLLALLLLTPVVGFSKSRTDIRVFLTDKMGVENPSLVYLMAGYYDTLQTIRLRIDETRKDIAEIDSKKLPLPKFKTLWETRLNRALVQYRIAWGVMDLFIDLTLSDVNLATGRKVDGFGLKALKRLHKDWFEPSNNPAMTAENDKKIKGYVLERASALYLNYLKLQALRHEPILLSEKLVKERYQKNQDLTEAEVKKAGESNAWLDDANLSLGNKDAVGNFIDQKLSDPKLRFAFYPNDELMPSAQKLVIGFKSLLHQPLPDFDLNKPNNAQKIKFAQAVLKDALPRTPELQNQAAGMVHLFFHVLGSIIDSYNVNTEDSLNLSRTALTALFRHVLDIDGNEKLSLERAALFQPLGAIKVAGTQFRPIDSILNRMTEKLKSNYLAEVESGPKLQDKDRDKAAKEHEFDVYHGRILKDLYGTDLSHWIWTAEEAKKDFGANFASDPRLDGAVKTPDGKRLESRTQTGTARPEIANVQDGDLWMEKGTGLGSDLISFATVPSDPSSKTKSFIEETSVFGIATSKMYHAWAGVLGWTEDKLQIAGLEGQADWVANLDSPGKKIDYTGTSHTGMVVTFRDEQYPQLARADLIDSFPNLPRQAWRRHGCGHSHSRLCMFLRVRKQWARKYVNSLTGPLEKTAPYQSLQRDLDLLGPKVKAPYHSVVGADAENQCHELFSKTFNFPTEEEMMKDRDLKRTAYDYCTRVLRMRGLREFSQWLQKRTAEGALNTDEGLIREMGKLVSEKARNIRTQQGWEKGFGVQFDDRFDTFTKGSLYCSEFAALSYNLAWGADVYPEGQFRQSIRKVEDILPESLIAKVTAGFIKVPWGERDTVFAPKGVIEDPKGREIWEVIGEMRRAFFGVNDE